MATSLFSRSPRALALVALCAFLPLNACYLASDAKSLEARVLHIEEQQQEFATTFSYTREELTTLVVEAEAQVRQLQKTLDDARSILGQTNANLGVQVEGMEARVGELQGQVEAQRFSADELQRALQALRTDLEFRLEQLER